MAIAEFEHAGSLAEPRWAALGEVEQHGRMVAFVGAHGGAGATTAALAVADDADRGVLVLDADLAGGDAAVRLGIGTRPGDAGLAGDVALAALVRRVPFGWFACACPRPELAWLIRDGALRRAAHEALRLAGLVLVDVGRPLGPACEPVSDADVVVLIWHAHRVDAAGAARRRLVRMGVEERRIVDCPVAPTTIERALGRWRGAGPCVDLARGDELLLLVEGRLASLPPREGR